MDAVEFLSAHQKEWKQKTLIYADPPYYQKGRELYYDFYTHKDHEQIAEFFHSLASANWIVSYDDVDPIRKLYETVPFLAYSINYSARNPVRGREIMFFSSGLSIPKSIESPLLEMDRISSEAGVQIRL